MKKKRVRKSVFGLVWFMVVVLVAAMLPGCVNNANPRSTEEPDTGASSSEVTASKTRTVVDLAGRTVEIPAHVTKLASLCGPSFETVIMLGGVDQVVVTGSSSMASAAWAKEVCPQYANIPGVEDATAPNVEELVKLGVEVVLYWDAYPDVIEALEGAGIAVVITQLNNAGISSERQFIEFKKREITLVGDVLGGDSIEKAREWCAYADKVTAKIMNVTSKLSPDQIPSVYYVRGPEALTIHGGVSNTRFLVDMAGGNLASKVDAKLLYQTTMEQVVSWNPEYIFMGRVNNVELVTKDPAWSSIKAVKDGHVYVNLKGPGPTDYSTDCFLLMEQIATILHPDLFKDINMKAEVREYYKKFYNYDLTDQQAEYVLNFKSPTGE